MKFPPPLLLILATLLWGGNFVIGRAVSGDIPPITLAFLRWIVAFLVFFPIAYQRTKKEWSALRQHWGVVIVLALTGVAAFNTLVYIGLHYTTSINASLMNSSTPIIIYILSFIFLKERLTKFQLLGTLLSLAGVLFIISGGSLQSLFSFSFNKGDLIVLVAVVCWSVYSLLIKKYAGKLPGYSTFLVTIVIGAIMLLPFAVYEQLTTSQAIVWNASTMGAIIYVGIIASIVAFLSWNTGVVSLGANKAGIYLNFIPLFATIFAVLFLNEQLLLAQVIGGIAVIAGVFISTMK
ncbi:DMT family transporter [Solibacillus isronensis]|uniref:DMT family transporter n=1 Tax=Solibacillus isronensis TaxID=412383 RepID=UPI002041AB3A|nr:DMT family transporter [Solibacillus isronensis]MCM3723090.1 DMT family transporter [Solibacillus isronensis]